MRSRLCSRRLHVSYQAWCELALQFFNRVGPLEWLGGFVLAGNKVLNGLLKLIQGGKMVRLQGFWLPQAEPNFKLIEPGGIGGHTIRLPRQLSLPTSCPFL